jgi:hypothetical protein
LEKQVVDESFSAGWEAFRSGSVDWKRTTTDTAYLAGVDAASRFKGSVSMYDLFIASTQDHVRSKIEGPFQISLALRGREAPLAPDIDITQENVLFWKKHRIQPPDLILSESMA